LLNNLIWVDIDSNFTFLFVIFSKKPLVFNQKMPNANIIWAIAIIEKQNMHLLSIIMKKPFH